MTDDWKHAKNILVLIWDFFPDDLAAAGIYINSAKGICPGWSLMPLFFPFNTTNRNKFSADDTKLAIDNMRDKTKDKLYADREESANNNGEDPNNKPGADIKILVRKKNINQNGDTSIQEKKKTKLTSVIIKKAIPSNFYLCKNANNKCEISANVLDW